MSDCAEAASPAVLQGQPTSPRAARLEKFKREQIVVDYLNRGVSVAEISARLGVGEKRMRAIIRELLARRMPAPPEEFVAIQVSRLNEVLLVAYSAMGEANLKAVDRVIRIVRELDRYHGFVAAERRKPESSRLEAPAEGTATFGAAFVCRAGFARQEAGAIAFESNRPLSSVRHCEERPPGLPQGDEAIHAAAAPCGPGWLRNARHDGEGQAEPDARPEIPPQNIEIIDLMPGIAKTPEVESPAEAATQPRPEEPAERAFRRTLEEAPLCPLEHPSRRIACGDAPQDEVEGGSDGRVESDNRPENPPQHSEIAQSAPVFGAASAVASPFRDPTVFRPIKLRVTLNGVMAC